MWQGVLELEHISTDDNFFSIGGHSIKTITIANLIYKVLGVQISMIDFLECNTIVELADGNNSEKIEIEKQGRSQYRIN
ncbi:acyl carrier protein [Brochothrix thermosphacta]|uniref:acyl carrier protein n=1 Tax=Brochothrix thermosphacta TaxID=2756 RepID=UPI00210A97DA|nr:acyl carrier protein [Brochothrix thermosphacta]